MKILAIEKPLKSINWSKFEQILKDEARRVYELYQCNYIREAYFNEKKEAVIVLECESKEQATEILNTLPLVESRLITFDLMELNPYTGYTRLIEPNT